MNDEKTEEYLIQLYRMMDEEQRRMLIAFLKRTAQSADTVQTVC